MSKLLTYNLEKLGQTTFGLKFKLVFKMSSNIDISDTDHSDTIFDIITTKGYLHIYDDHIKVGKNIKAIIHPNKIMLFANLYYDADIKEGGYMKTETSITEDQYLDIRKKLSNL